MRDAALPGVFIAGTDTEVGKTRVAVALLHALAHRGLAAIGVKPVATGLDAAGVNEDVARLHSASRLGAGLRASPSGAPSGTLGDTPSGSRGGGLLAPGPPLELADINPYRFSPPISPHLAARRVGVVIEPARILSACQRLAPRCDLLVVEGTGGWLAPISESLCMAHVALELALPVVLVVGLRLGCLNHALLTAAAIAADRLPLAGWIGTVLDPHMLALEENIASLRERLPAPLLGLIAHSADRTADAAQLAAAAGTVAEVARHSLTTRRRKRRSAARASGRDHS